VCVGARVDDHVTMDEWYEEEEGEEEAEEEEEAGLDGCWRWMSVEKGSHDSMAPAYPFLPT
jgi:hypothetical protein